MSQTLASLSRNFVVILVCSVLAACNGSYTAFESDRDFDTDVKTADIEKDNAELKTLAALQSAFFGHYQSAVNEFLDASDLPMDAAPTANEKEFKRICTNGSPDSGYVLYSYSRDEGEEHQVGDQISVDYNDCMENDSIYSGSMTGRYTEIKGLNHRFVEMNTSQCLNKVRDELGIENTAVVDVTYDEINEVYIFNGVDVFPRGAGFTSVSSNSIYLPGDELRFERVGNDLRVDLLRVTIIDDTDDDLANEEKTVTRELSFVIKEGQKIVVVLVPYEQSSALITSVDGDQIYTITDLKGVRQSCQSFSRTLNVSLTDFSTSKNNFIETILNGSITLEEVQESTNRMDQSIIDSDFTTTVIQGNSSQRYSMKDYRVEKAINVASNSYSYEFQGLISNSGVLDGQIELTTLGKLYGSFDSQFPSTGVFELKGKGLERVNLEPDNSKILLKVDFNGDSTGNGFADIDTTINTSWLDLFERNFIE